MTSTDLKLQRDVRLLKLYAGAMTLVVAALALTGARTSGEQAAFSSIRTERIDLVDAQGNTRLLLSSPEHMPGPKGPNDRKPGSRNIVPAGMIFYDAKQHEIGGIALAEDKKGKLAAMLFDYDRNEAGGFYRRIAPDGSAFSSFFINDAAPAGFKNPMSRDWGRIKLQNPDRNAEILLTDVQGRTRIQLRVDNQGEARIEILDDKGDVVFQAPESTATGKPKTR